jgi:hypothetical protein
VKEGRRHMNSFCSSLFLRLRLEEKVVIGDVPMGLLTNNIRPVVCGAAGRGACLACARRPPEYYCNGTVFPCPQEKAVSFPSLKLN